VRLCAENVDASFFKSFALVERLNLSTALRDSTSLTIRTSVFQSRRPTERSPSQSLVRNDWLSGARADHPDCGEAYLVGAMRVRVGGAVQGRSTNPGLKQIWKGQRQGGAMDRRKFLIGAAGLVAGTQLDWRLEAEQLRGREGSCRVAAYYFGNYHQDVRNVKAHGPAWTEWNLVKSATPRFQGTVNREYRCGDMRMNRTHEYSRKDWR